MKQWLRSVATITFVTLLTVCGCKGPTQNTSGHHIAYITNGVASFWTIAKIGAEKAGRDLSVKVSVHMPAEGIADQKRIVEDLLVRGVDGVAISLIDPANQTTLVNEIASQTKLITQDADAPAANRLAYVGMDNYRAGRMVGELIKQTLPSGGTIAIVIGRLEQDNARRRRQGVIDEVLGRSFDSSRFDLPGQELTNGQFTFVTTLTDQFDRVKAKSNCEDILLRYPKLTAIAGLFAYNIPACLEALKQINAVGSVKLFAFDEAEETLQAIQDGTVVGTVVQNPYEYGYQSVKLLDEILRGNMSAIPQSKFIDIPARTIVKSNVTEFWADLKAKVSAQ
jgi:ribose transport system substrate-binding protein